MVYPSVTDPRKLWNISAPFVPFRDGDFLIFLVTLFRGRGLQCSRENPCLEDLFRFPSFFLEYAFEEKCFSLFDQFLQRAMTFPP